MIRDQESQSRLEDLKQLITSILKNESAQVYLFGSWARGEEKRTSDIDIGVYPKDELPAKKWVELRECIEESSLPYNVDIVDLSKVEGVFLTKVQREGVLWKDWAKE